MLFALISQGNLSNCTKIRSLQVNGLQRKVQPRERVIVGGLTHPMRRGSIRRSATAFPHISRSYALFFNGAPGPPLCLALDPWREGFSSETRRARPRQRCGLLGF